MKHVDLKGKKIRLFFHTDLDGTISANLIQLFSGAQVIRLVPCPYQNYQKPEKEDGLLDVFVDCRAKDRNEDIRIDHHSSGEDNAYLDREGIIVDTRFGSAVSLVAEYLGAKVDKQILEEMDKADSGKKNVFSKFIMGNRTLNSILVSLGITKEDYQNYEKFKDNLLSLMEKGFAIEDIEDTPKGYEQKLEKNFKIIVEDIKKPGKHLIKLVHSPTKEGAFLEHVFSIKDSDFFGHVLPYVQQHYYEESKKNDIGIYTVVGFRARNFEFDPDLVKVVKDDHPEPYQIFISRSHDHTSINIGDLIQAAKGYTGITNGGGRDSVGGLNTSDKEKAVKALRYIVEYIEKNCP